MIEAFTSSQETLLSALTHHEVVWVPAQEPALIPRHPLGTAPALRGREELGQSKGGRLSGRAADGGPRGTVKTVSDRVAEQKPVSRDIQELVGRRVPEGWREGPRAEAKPAFSAVQLAPAL